jgi:hypothetical protein
VFVLDEPEFEFVVEALTLELENDVGESHAKRPKQAIHNNATINSLY